MVKSVESRFLILISTALLVVVAPLFALFLVLSSEQYAKTRDQRIEVLIDANSQALARPLWDFDADAIEQAAATLVSDPLIMSVKIHDTSSLLDITHGKPGIKRLEGFESARREIVYKSVSGPRTVGWIDIYFEPAGLFSAFDAFSIALSLIFLIAILIVGGTAVIANRLMITRPLSKLSEAIDATRRMGSRQRVAWVSGDEIGRLARSFNEMQHQLEREELELKSAHETTTEVYNRTPAMLFSTDASERITAVSDYWLIATGFAREEVIGKLFPDLLQEADRALFRARCADSGGERTGKPGDITARFVCADGHTMDVLIAGTVLPTTSRRPATSLNVMMDVSELRQSEQRNRQQAITDHLTGLLNRQGFEITLADAIQSADREEAELACLFIDLDRFKTINDTLGHAAGDAVLCQFVDRLHGLLSGGAIAARLGGDEFAILIGSADAGERAEILATRVVSLFDTPFLVDGQDVRLSASVGLAVYPHHAKSAAELLQNADMAMYTRKRTGKNGADIFDPAMLDDTRLKAEIESNIEQALKEDWFDVHFQPILELKTNRILGFEALLRLIRPDRQTFSPADIVRVAEETGSIHRIGNLVLEKALAHLSSLSQVAGLEDSYVAVNFSALQFDTGLSARIAAALAKFDILPRRLVVEITEALLMEDDPRVRGTLEEISGFGCAIALDDFGTGFSSLNYLNRFPVNIVKVDQSFVRAMEDASPEVASKSRALIEGIAAISDKMNCKVIAEGIETAGQRQFMVETGIEAGQGYFFRTPAAVADLLQEYRSHEGTGMILDDWRLKA